MKRIDISQKVFKMPKSIDSVLKNDGPAGAAENVLPVGYAGSVHSPGEPGKP